MLCPNAPIIGGWAVLFTSWKYIFFRIHLHVWGPKSFSVKHYSLFCSLAVGAISATSSVRVSVRYHCSTEKFSFSPIKARKRKMYWYSARNFVFVDVDVWVKSYQPGFVSAQLLIWNQLREGSAKQGCFVKADLVCWQVYWKIPNQSQGGLAGTRKSVT